MRWEQWCFATGLVEVLEKPEAEARLLAADVAIAAGALNDVTLPEVKPVGAISLAVLLPELDALIA